MIKRLTRVGNSLAVVIDKRLLEQLGIDDSTELELSTNGDVIVLQPVRDARRAAKLKKIMSEIDEDFGGVFRRLAE